jgi:hypothetical protein
MKFLIVLLTAFLIAGAAGAQNINSPKGHINIGIKGGVNFYDINNDNNVNYDSKVGFNIGLLGHIHVAKHFALQPEIQYSAQGAKYTNNNGNNKINLNYINVPVLLQYMWDNGFRLQAGPQAGILVSAKSENNGNTVDIKNNIKSLDLGLSFGASYIHPSTGVGIDLRYNLGLSNINENSDLKSTNRGLQLSLFYIFGHTSKNSRN